MAAQQFFSRAIDFGFTKTPEGDFEKWGPRSDPRGYSLGDSESVGLT